MLHILHIVESYGGGVFTVLNQLMQDQVTRHRVTLVYSRRPETAASLGLDSRIACHELPMPAAPGLGMGGAVLALRGLIQDLKPDIVHLHSSMAGALGRVAALSAGFPMRQVVYTPHGFSFLREDKSVLFRGVYKLVERGLAKLGGTVVACSLDEFRLAQDLTRHTALVRNAIDVAGIAKLAGTPAPRAARPFTVAVLGRVCAQKGPDRVACIAKGVTAQLPGTRFLWLGGESPGIPGDPTEYVPWLTREEALRKLADEADVLLQASLWEGLPMALLEGMALGLPCVASDIIGNRDAVADGKSGYLGNSVQEMVGHLLHLGLTPESRERMGLAGLQRVTSLFGKARMATETEDLYAMLLRQATPSAAWELG